MPVQVVGDLALAVVHQHEVAHPLERRQQRGQQGEQRAVDEDHLVVGVVDDVRELLGEEPDVQRVQHPPGARGGEVQLEVAGRVPGERGHPPVGGDAERVEGAAEAPRALRPVGVGHVLAPGRGRRHHALVAEVPLRPLEQGGDRERHVLHQPLHGAEVSTGATGTTPDVWSRRRSGRRVGMRRPSPLVLPASIALLASIALAACGDDDDDDDDDHGGHDGRRRLPTTRLHGHRRHDHVGPPARTARPRRRRGGEVGSREEYVETTAEEISDEFGDLADCVAEALINDDVYAAIQAAGLTLEQFQEDGPTGITVDDAVGRRRRPPTWPPAATPRPGHPVRRGRGAGVRRGSTSTTSKRRPVDRLRRPRRRAERRAAGRARRVRRLPRGDDHHHQLSPHASTCGHPSTAMRAWPARRTRVARRR